MRDLAGRTAVITGAGSGSGRALALACAQEGMRVVVADVEAEAGEQTAREIAQREGQSLFVRTDVSRRAALDHLAEQAYARFGAVHLLCNNAGIVTVGRFLDHSWDDWRWTLTVNLEGVIHGLMAFLPRMLAQGGEAHVVNTASIAGLVAIGGRDALGLAAYTTSKYGVVAISETLRDELAPQGIGVSVLCPGGVSTRIGEAGRNRPEEFGGRQGPVLRPDRPGAQPGMDPAQVAQIVLRGVRENRAYLFTHPETRELVERRFQAILHDFER